MSTDRQLLTVRSNGASAQRTTSSSTSASTTAGSSVGSSSDDEVCQEHLKFWKKLKEFDVPLFGRENSRGTSRQNSDRFHLDAPYAEVPPTYGLYIFHLLRYMISCKDKKWMLFFIIPATILFQCFVYRAICKWPLYFTTLLLPEPFGSHYNDFITASDMPWLLYSIQLLLFLPVWFVLTGMFAPAGKWFEYERDAGKYVTQPGMYFKEGGTMDRLRNYYSPDTLQRYVSGVDPLQTPWIIGPDAQTNVPFIFAEGQFYGKFVVEGVNYERVWIKMFDGDLVSLDWSFPSGGYRKGSPVLIALHGMNGNSELSMIKDQVKRANDRGWTAVAVTQRGCDDTQIRNMLFNGEDAYKDLHVIAGVVRECCENSLIIASGISFGGVTVANYPAIYGKESRVDGCVSVAGSPDLSVCAKYRYSHRAYTPGVAHCKKIQSCYDRRKLDILHRAGVDVEHVVSENCWDMVDWDTHVTCKLINKKDVFDAANAVSLAPSDLSDPRSQKPKNVTVPVLCVQAQNDTFMDVNSADVSVAETNDNIMYVVTKEGGHCGWPCGWNPAAYGHERMSSFIIEFMDAVVKMKSAEKE